MNLGVLLGKEAPAAWRWLVDHTPSIAAVSLFSFFYPPSFQQRITLGLREEEVLRRARELVSRCRVPFWDAILIEGLEMGALGEQILEAVSYAEPAPISSIEMSRSSILKGELSVMVAATPVSHPLAICSRFRRLDGNYYHFPLFDARCEVSERSEASLVNIGKRLLPDGGLIVNSGKSYHIIGCSPVSAAGLLNLLAAGLLYAPVLDRVYIAHHLRRRWCSLRVSQGGRANIIPRVVATF